ncbi:hypothetical protein [Streptomyces sp. SGAir0957]
MDRAIYLALAKMCGDNLAYCLPSAVRPLAEQMPDVSCAIYVASDRRGIVCYVGSVCRPNDPCGLASHIGEYLLDVSKTAKWHELQLLPLRDGTPEPDVRSLAGEVAGWLLPYDNQRWPTAG